MTSNQSIELYESLKRLPKPQFNEVCLYLQEKYGYNLSYIAVDKAPTESANQLLELVKQNPQGLDHVEEVLEEVIHGKTIPVKMPKQDNQFAKKRLIALLTSFIVILSLIFADCITITPILVHRLPFLGEICSTPKDDTKEDVNDPDDTKGGVNDPGVNAPTVINAPTVSIVKEKGIGFPLPDAKNPTLKYETAKSAAEAVARKKLAERIGAIVKSITITKNKQFFEEEIEIRVDTILKSSRIVSVNENSDGSVEVVMEAPLKQ
jgi:hypothetical protein